MTSFVPAVLANCTQIITAGLILAVASLTASEAASAFLPARSQTLPPSGARALCNLYNWACRPPSGRRLTEAQIRAAFAVNGRVSGGVCEVAHAAQYGRAEVWCLPTRRGGYCEDSALMKERDLIAGRLPPERLLVATVLHLRRGGHAVLVLRTDPGRGP